MAWATIKDKEAMKRRVALGSLHWGLTIVLPHKALEKIASLLTPSRIQKALPGWHLMTT